MRGKAADRGVIVLKTSSSVDRCTNASTKLKSVAPMSAIRVNRSAGLGTMLLLSSLASASTDCHFLLTIYCGCTWIPGADQAEHAAQDRPNCKSPPLKFRDCAAILVTFLVMAVSQEISQDISSS